MPLGLPGDRTISQSPALCGRRTGILPRSVFGVSGKVSTSPDVQKILLKLVDVYLPILRVLQMLLYSLHWICD